MHYNCFFFGGFLPFFRAALGENAQKTGRIFEHIAQNGKKCQRNLTCKISGME